MKPIILNQNEVLSNNNRQQYQSSRYIIANIYNDRQLSADGDLWEAGQCIWEMKQSLLLSDDDDNSSTSTIPTSSNNKSKESNIEKGRRTAKMNFNETLTNIQTWSAEIPNLYALTISLYEILYNNTDENKKNPTSNEILYIDDMKYICCQSEAIRFGFRTINIVLPGIIYINHQRIKNFA
jgi:beta-galactosidase/beta-glucuronidase